MTKEEALEIHRREIGAFKLNIFPGTDWENITGEELLAELRRVDEALKNGDFEAIPDEEIDEAFPVSKKPKLKVREFVENLKKSD